MRFRKFIALLAILVLLSSSARAELIFDLSDATLEELMAARDAIQARIDALQGTAEAEVVPSGTYLVGHDIYPGIYVLIENVNAILPSFTLRDAQTNETLEFEIVNNQIVVELSAGQLMQLSDASAYPIAIAPEVVVTEEIPLGAGGYWVGAQIPEGRYVIKAAYNAIFACYSLYDAPISARSRILEFVMVHEPIFLSLKEGNYIVISDCTMACAAEE